MREKSKVEHELYTEEAKQIFSEQNKGFKKAMNEIGKEIHRRVREAVKEGRKENRRQWKGMSKEEKKQMKWFKKIMDYKPKIKDQL